jgi:hypothetical protein
MPPITASFLIFLPNKPLKIDPTSGKNGMSHRLLYIKLSYQLNTRKSGNLFHLMHLQKLVRWLSIAMPSPLEHIEIVGID